MQSIFYSFNSTIRRVNNGRLVTLRFIVTDFSYVLMHACIWVFNDRLQLDAYLQLTYNILSGGCTWAQMWNVPVTVCRTHAEGDVDVAVNSRVKQLLSTDHAVLHYSAMHH